MISKIPNEFLDFILQKKLSKKQQFVFKLSYSKSLTKEN